MDQPDSYVVTIPYREPSYELRHGGPPKNPYRATYTVQAANPDEAIDMAVRRFEQKALDSGAPGQREIQREGIRVERQSP